MYLIEPVTIRTVFYKPLPCYYIIARYRVKIAYICQHDHGRSYGSEKHQMKFNVLLIKLSRN